MVVYYVYILIDPITGIPFYVGKGQKKRMYQHIKDVKRGRIPNRTNTKLGNKIKKILSSGNKVKYKKIFITENEQEVYDKEKTLIAEIGLKNLCNLTEGGDGYIGIRFSEDHRQKISMAHKGKILSEITKKRISESVKKTLSTEDVKSKMIGRKLSDKTRHKMRLAKIGNTHHLGHTHTDKTKEKISKIHKGKTVSDETKKKIGITCRLKFLKQRQQGKKHHNYDRCWITYNGINKLIKQNELKRFVVSGWKLGRTIHWK